MNDITLTDDRLSTYMGLALAGIDREFPHHPGWVLTDAADARSPRSKHPAFFGCYDWHSAVHAHWTLVRLTRLHPSHAETPRAHTVIDEHMTPERIAVECAVLERDAGFERPYGWAWALALHAETVRANAPCWATALEPLATLLRERMRVYLGRLEWPVRAGTHANTAFALGLMIDAAREVGAAAHADDLAKHTHRLFARDRHWTFRFEPSGEDFLSPGLCEADAMRRVLDPESYATWLDDFLGADVDTLAPVDVSDPEDGRIGHLAGLNLTRGWMLRAIASALPDDHPRRRGFDTLGIAHVERGLEQTGTGHYAGDHWLGTFATYALTTTR